MSSSGFSFGHLGYLLCAFLTAGMCGALYETNRQLEASWGRVEDDVALLDALSRFGEDAHTAEATHRGWMLSPVESLRRERDAALGNARSAVADIQRLAPADANVQDD